MDSAGKELAIVEDRFQGELAGKGFEHIFIETSVAGKHDPFINDESEAEHTLFP